MHVYKPKSNLNVPMSLALGFVRAILFTDENSRNRDNINLNTPYK